MHLITSNYLFVSTHKFHLLIFIIINNQLHLGYGEHLTEISGTVDQYQGLTVITSLSFKVGRRVNGPYGRATGTTFSLPVVKGKITGFFGNYGDYLDSLGVLIRPLN